MKESGKMDTNIKGHKLLARAIEIAVKAHAGQQRWSGEPYILHPMRVMLNMDTVDEKIVAILHDTVEDTNVTLNLLRTEGFEMYNAQILFALDKLTHTKGIEYMTYIMTLANYNISTKVKLADLRDNMDITQLRFADHIDVDRLHKYYKAYRYLKGD